MWSSVRSAFRAWLPKSRGMPLGVYAKPQTPQEEMDMLKLFIAVHWYKHQSFPEKTHGKGTGKSDGPSLDVDFAEAHQQVASHVWTQTQHLVDSYLQSMMPRKQLVPQISTQAMDTSDEEPELNVDTLKEKTGFVIEPRQSTVANAGLGVLCASGQIGVGQVAAYYPGTIYAPSLVKKIGFVLADGLPNLYLVARHDAVVIDGLPHGSHMPPALHYANEQPRISDNSFPSFSYSISSASSSQTNTNPNVSSSSSLSSSSSCSSSSKHIHYALAHLVNHPPPGTPPNVMLAPLNVPTGHQLPWLDWHQRPSVFDPIYPRMDDISQLSVALVAIRPIQQGEELFLNYRLNPKLKLPEWYHPVDEQEDRRRWTR